MSGLDPGLSYPELADSSREPELLAAWRAANAEWQADVFDKEKGDALEAAHVALDRERRRLYRQVMGESEYTGSGNFKDETGDRDPALRDDDEDDESEGDE